MPGPPAWLSSPAPGSPPGSGRGPVRFPPIRDGDPHRSCRPASPVLLLVDPPPCQRACGISVPACSPVSAGLQLPQRTNGMNGRYADNRDRTGQQRAAQASGHRREGHRAFASRRGRGRWAVLAAAAVASGYVFVGAETARPGPPRVRPWPPVSLSRVSWPATGVSAAGISGLGVVAEPGARRPVPIASVAKVMTAYVIVHDHPLNAGGRMRSAGGSAAGSQPPDPDHRGQLRPARDDADRAASRAQGR